MANFKNETSAIVAAILSFPIVTVSTMQIFKTATGQRAGFQIINLSQADGSVFQISQIFDVTSGTPVLVGTVAVVTGLDLTGGMFSSGCWADGDPLQTGTKFYRVDY